MKDRILQIRKKNRLTQDAFAKKLNLSKNFVWMLEKGERIPSDRTISDICREFNINENWLRYGTEPIKKNIIENNTEYIKELVSEDNPFFDIIKGIIKTYNSLDKKSQEILQDFSEELLKELNTASSKENAKEALETATIEQTFVNIEKAEEKYNKKNLEELSDEEQIELYRQELKHEREVKEKSEALRKSG